MKILLGVILAAALSACSWIAPNSDAPNISRLAKVCAVRNEAMDAWTLALVNNLPTVDAAIVVDGFLTRSNACEEVATLTRLAAAEDADAEARVILTSVAITVSGLVATTLIDSASPELSAVGGGIVASLERLGLHYVEDI